MHEFQITGSELIIDTISTALPGEVEPLLVAQSQNPRVREQVHLHKLQVLYVMMVTNMRCKLKETYLFPLAQQYQMYNVDFSIPTVHD